MFPVTCVPAGGVDNSALQTNYLYEITGNDAPAGLAAPMAENRQHGLMTDE
jgi:hypothetical protein